MLEPRIVAANTQVPHAVSVRSDVLARIAASSHGGLAALAMFHLLAPLRAIKHQVADAGVRGRGFREITDPTAEFS
jgi:hypothetical protein